jgi:PAS domain S-box-containing protein
MEDTEHDRLPHQPAGYLSLRLMIIFLLLGVVPLGVTMIFIRRTVVEAVANIQIQDQLQETVSMGATFERASSPDDFQTLVSQVSGHKQVVFLLDKENRYLAHPDINRLGVSAQGDLSPLVLQNISSSSSGSFIDPADATLVGYYKLENQPGLLVIISDNQVMNQTLLQAEQSSVIQLGLSLAIVAMIGGLIIWLLVGRPLRRFTSVVQKIEGGSLNLRVNPDEMDDELAVLATAFNHMVDQLKTLIEHLEQRVAELQETQAALQNSEDRFRTIFNSVNEAIFIHDAMTGEILDVNQKMLDLFKCTRQQALSMSIADLSANEPAYTMENALALIQRAFVEGPVLQEWRCRDLEGRTFWCEVNLKRSVINGQVRVLVSARDITDRKRDEMEIQVQYKRLEALHTIDLAIANSLELAPTLNVLVDQVILQLGVDAADILLLRPEQRRLEYAAGWGFRRSGITHLALQLGEGCAGRIALTRQVMTSEDPEFRSSLLRSNLLFDERFVSYVGCPLEAKGSIKGVLEIFNRSPLDFNPGFMDFLKTIAGQAAIALDNAELYENQQKANLELELAYEKTLEGWAGLMDLWDEETEGHSQRVADLTVILARKLNMDDNAVRYLRWGALLHDLGKYAIPQAIVTKPGPLSGEEWEIMRRHPAHALEKLYPIEHLRLAIDIPYCHHEKWDGSGYPRGLRGTQIPLAARIFAVVDVYDALRSDRPYRKAWNKQQALQHIQDSAGSHFDPQVVDAFMQAIIESEDEILRRPPLTRKAGG